MAFPLPSLLSSIKDLLLEVQWLDGLILVTDSQQATFVPFSQVDSLLRMVRARPNGQIVVERLCMALLDDHDGGGAKPVLVFQGDDRFWLGMMGLNGSHSNLDGAVAHLDRCFALSS
ncbi:conserved hypothetical [Prochlorococcus marinus str. MIT 9313]|uniref:Conserved hypothetical n=1 Tax=Prochlorococcus marinus (strain MIT 9313) TaxID=74547 RepID=Q7V8Q6_PROMM|nr:conserved hypothetical [Prochlorococcus marinus str. MIT 9313]